MKNRFLGNRKLIRTSLFVIGFALLCLTTNRSRADIVLSQSEGYGTQFELQLGTLSANLLAATPSQRATGTAPAAYSTTANAGNVNLNFGTNISVPPLTTVALNLATVDGLLSSSATSTVDGAAGPKITTASGLANGLSLGIGNASLTTLGVTTQVPLLNISASTIGSTSDVVGDYNAYTTNGSALIQNLAIRVANLDLDLLGLLGANASIDAQGFLTVAPNTQLLNLGGLTGLNLTLNEQIVTGDGISTRGLETNALRFSFNNVGLAGVPIPGTISGDVQIGHSYSAMVGTVSAVPEPGSVAALAMIGSVLFTGGKLRSRRKKSANSEETAPTAIK